MEIYTIGFTQKRASTFFDLLLGNGIQRLVDIRLNPGGQLAGFAKKEDLPFFLARLVNGCSYVHLLELAPTDEILKGFRAHKNWPQYTARFMALMRERNIPDTLNRVGFEQYRSCLLCSEAQPDQCHRGLVAELLKSHWPGVEIIHL